MTHSANGERVYCLVSTYCRAHVSPALSCTPPLIQMHVSGSSACIDAGACTDVDATCVDARVCVDTNARVHAPADAFSLLLLRTVSSYSLTLMCLFAAPTMWGFEVHFVASYPHSNVGIAAYLSSLLYMSGPPPGPGCSFQASAPKKTDLLAIKHAFCPVLTTYITAQERPQSSPNEDPITHTP
jgi:hypothetical protein